MYQGIQPFSPEALTQAIAAHRIAGHNDEFFPVSRDGRMEFEKGKPGWMSWRTQYPDQPAYQAFCRSVRLYMERNEELLKLKELQNADPKGFKPLAERTVKVVSSDNYLKLQDWEKQAAELTDNVTDIHQAEVEVVRVMLSKGGENFRTELKKSILNLAEKVSSQTYKNDALWDRNLDDFLQKEKADIRKECGKHLAPEGMEKEPDAFLHDLDEELKIFDEVLDEVRVEVKYDVPEFVRKTRQLQSKEPITPANTFDRQWGAFQRYLEFVNKIGDDFHNVNIGFSDKFIQVAESGTDEQKAIYFEHLRKELKESQKADNPLDYGRRKMNPFPKLPEASSSASRNGTLRSRKQRIFEAYGKFIVSSYNNRGWTLNDIDEAVKNNFLTAGVLEGIESTNPDAQKISFYILQQSMLEADIPGLAGKAFTKFVSSPENNHRWSENDFKNALEKNLIDKQFIKAALGSNDAARSIQFHQMAEILEKFSLFEQLDVPAAQPGLQPTNDSFSLFAPTTQYSRPDVNDLPDPIVQNPEEIVDARYYSDSTPYAFRQDDWLQNQDDSLDYLSLVQSEQPKALKSEDLIQSRGSHKGVPEQATRLSQETPGYTTAVPYIQPSPLSEEQNQAFEQLLIFQRTKEINNPKHKNVLLAEGDEHLLLLFLTEFPDAVQKIISGHWPTSKKAISFIRKEKNTEDLHASQRYMTPSPAHATPTPPNPRPSHGESILTQRRFAAKNLASREQQIRNTLGENLIGSNDEFNVMMEKIYPEKLLSTEKPSLKDKLRAFRQMQQYAANQEDPLDEISSMPSWQKDLLKAQKGNDEKPRELTIEDFVTLVNYDLLSNREIDNIFSSIGDQATKGVIPRIDQQTINPKMVGVGLTTWGNTCWLNTSLQTMMRFISEDALTTLENSQLDNPNLNQLRQSFCLLMRRGKEVLKSGQGAMLTTLQMKFLQDCRICAREKLLGHLSEFLDFDDFSHMKQYSASDFIATLFQKFGLNNHPDHAFKNVQVHYAHFQGQEVQRVVEWNNEEPYAAIDTGEPGNQDLHSIKMEDWFNSTLLTQDLETQQWQSNELPHSLRNDRHSVPLATEAKQMRKIDTPKFQKFRIVPGNGFLKKLSQQALLNSGMRIEIPVINEHNKPVTLQAKLESVALHKGDIASGHYLQLTFDDQGQCYIQDDNHSMKFEDFCELRGEKWRFWQDMITKADFTPAWCTYQKTGIKSAAKTTKEAPAVRKINSQQLAPQRATLAPPRQRASFVPPQMHQAEIAPVQSKRVENCMSLNDVLNHIIPGQPCVVAFDLDDTLTVETARNDQYCRIKINKDTEVLFDRIRRQSGVDTTGAYNAKILLVTQNSERRLKNKMTETGLKTTLFDRVIRTNQEPDEPGSPATKGLAITSYLAQTAHPAKYVLFADDANGHLENVEQSCMQHQVPCVTFHFRGAEEDAARYKYIQDRDLFPEITMDRYLELARLSKTHDWNGKQMVRVLVEESPSMRAYYDAEKARKIDINRKDLADDYDWKKQPLPKGYQKQS